jgi:Flp pilus assembly protein TadG
LEFAMVVPLLGLLLALLSHTGLLLADAVVAQGVAREVGRAAAVDGAERARQVAERLAGDREVRVDLDERGGMVEARIELVSGAFAAIGVDVRVPATATFRAERPVPVGLDGG